MSFLDGVGISRHSYPMGHEKKSLRKKYTDYYDSRMIDILRDECVEDIEYFGFVYGEANTIFNYGSAV